MDELFTQFSFPAGIPSHVAPETPGSIHEGGELGYALSTPTARPSTTRTSSSPASSATARRRPARWPPRWHSNKFLNPARDGAVLPILHLNGYKIANPTRALPASPTRS
jgi:xylulose-5-phosphate/fructose-6-phosphate phosphoketolase